MKEVGKLSENIRQLFIGTNEKKMHENGLDFLTHNVAIQVDVLVNSDCEQYV